LGFGGGFGFGNIGWVALAPYEPFYPWWGYGSRTNVTYVTNTYYVVNNNAGHHHHHDRVFGNARYNGVTYVAHQNFVDGRFEHMRGADPSKLRSIHPVRGAVPAIPTEANLRFSNRPVPSQLATVSTALTGGTFAGSTIAVRRTPFVQQREAFAPTAHVRAVAAPQPPAVQRVPVTYGTTTTTVPVTATREVHATRDVNAARDANDPWARFGASRGAPVTHAATPASAATATSATASGDAWNHYGAARPAGSRDATTMRATDTPVHRAPAVQEPPRTYAAPHESREYNAPRAAQQQGQQPAAVQQRSAPPPPARTEHPPAAKTTTPH
ncbi:MAG: hypothetical protein QOF71_3174, partial [Candidatus Eremiobacteraeota bacterium]|nr:hypothetical protein [Candidatus Eremiobacteraeota bacterium]